MMVMGVLTVVVNAHAVVECLFSELLLGVVEDCVCERSAGEGDVVDSLGFGRFQEFCVTEEG